MKFNSEWHIFFQNEDVALLHNIEHLTSKDKLFVGLQYLSWLGSISDSI